MALDLRPRWKSGHATVRELSAQLPSIRCVMAGWDAAENARITLASYVFVGDGQHEGMWVAHCHGAVKAIYHAGGAVSQQYTPPDHTQISAFVRHWHRLTSLSNYKLVVIDAVTERVLART